MPQKPGRYRVCGTRPIIRTQDSPGHTSGCERMSRERIGVRDWVIAAGVAAILLATGLSEQDSAANLDLLGYGLLTASGLALAARRRAPVPVLAVTGLCAVGYQAAGVDVPAVATCSRCTPPCGQDTARSRWWRA
jgi:hypothetical protein